MLGCGDDGGRELLGGRLERHEPHGRGRLSNRDLTVGRDIARDNWSSGRQSLHQGEAEGFVGCSTSTSTFAVTDQRRSSSSGKPPQHAAAVRSDFGGE